MGFALTHGDIRVVGIAPEEFKARIAAKAALMVAGASVLIAEPNHQEFMVTFLAAQQTASEIFLCDPAWAEQEWTQVAALVQPDMVFGKVPPLWAKSAPVSRPRKGSPMIMIPTGGSSGFIKFACHDEETLGSAVAGFCAHFKVTRVNQVGLLPLYHISGFMAWIRSLWTGGLYFPWSSKALEKNEFPPLPVTHNGWFISIVPTQLQRLLKLPEAVAWLRGFKAIFVGGGPTWKELLDAAAAAKLPLSITYGSTETAAMVCALTPEEFLHGSHNCGHALPHAQVEIRDGRICVRSDSLFHGYYPMRSGKSELVTDDLGRWDSAGRLEVIGRVDDMIISGGKKIYPSEVEAALRATGEFSDLCVLGLADLEWGSMVVAFYPRGETEPDFERITLAVGNKISAYKLPKRWISVSPWPRNEQGKVNRAKLKLLAEQDTAADI